MSVIPERVDPVTIVHCHFYIRRPAGDALYEYEPVNISNLEGSGQLLTQHPPLVGDLIFLWDSLKKTGGMFRVLDRSWRHSSFGSMNWPYIQSLPIVGPALDVIVEIADGLFRDEAPVPPEEGE